MVVCGLNSHRHKGPQPFLNVPFNLEDGWRVFRERLRPKFNWTPWIGPSVAASQHTNVHRPTSFVLDSLVSVHRNTQTYIILSLTLERRMIVRIALTDHTLSPKGKWHNRDTKASRLHPRRAAPSRLRWGSTLVRFRGNVWGVFCCFFFLFTLDQSPTLYEN